MRSSSGPTPMPSYASLALRKPPSVRGSPRDGRDPLAELKAKAAAASAITSTASAAPATTNKAPVNLPLNTAPAAPALAPPAPSLPAPTSQDAPRSATAPAAAPALQKPRYYSVRVQTGDKVGAGTDADITIALIGESGTTKEMLLDDEKNNFERNMVRSAEG